MKITTTPDEARGSVIVTGTNIPQATCTVYRYEDDGDVVVLRGAQDFAVTTGTFTVEDPEAPFDAPLRYVVLFQIAGNVDPVTGVPIPLVQQNRITNPSLETNLTNWAPGPLRTLSRLTLQSPGGNTGTDQPYDLTTITPQQTKALVPLNPNDPIYDIVRDPATNQWYVLQTIPGSVGSAKSAVISRLTADGVLIDSMTLRNAGPGQAFDLERIGGDVWFWVSWNSIDTSGNVTAYELGKVRYSAGLKTKDALTSANWVVVDDFTPNYDLAKLDVANNLVVFRIESGTYPNRSDTYVRRQLSDVLVNTDEVHGEIGPFNVDVDDPEGNGHQLNGFAFFDNVLYRYTGTIDNVDPCTVSVYTFPDTGTMTGDDAFAYSLDVSMLGNQVDGTPLGGYRSPNGLSIYRLNSGEIVLVVGVTNGATTSRQHRGYLYVQPRTPPTEDVGNSAFIGTHALLVSGQSGSGPTSMPAVNMALNPSVATLGGWSNHLGSTTLTLDSTSPISAPTSAMVTKTSAFGSIAFLRITGGYLTPVNNDDTSSPEFQAVTPIVGKVMAWSLNVKCDVDAQADVGVFTLDASGNQIDGVEEIHLFAANQVTRVGCTFLVPPDSVGCMMDITVDPQAATVIGTRTWFDNLLIELDSGRTYAPADVFGYHPAGIYHQSYYADGDTPGYHWEGIPAQSITIKDA